MAQLPYERVATNSVWSYTGCDYFGPMIIKCGRKREKRWGCLFTCLSVRAVHLEIASSLNADSVILALRRFIAFRGKPKKLFSDNGTNFVGTSRELKEALVGIDSDKIHDTLAERGIEWCFIPPRAPHMGGAWERLVRSVKTSLKAVLRDQCVNEDT
jgi:transposase InsO family protein